MLSEMLLVELAAVYGSKIPAVKKMLDECRIELSPNLQQISVVELHCRRGNACTSHFPSML